MIETPKQPGRPSGGETGAMPRVDVEPRREHEPLPPKPATLLEADEGGGITGMMPAARESEDKAKLNDDPAPDAAAEN